METLKSVSRFAGKPAEILGTKGKLSRQRALGLEFGVGQNATGQTVLSAYFGILRAITKDCTATYKVFDRTI